ncbi:Holliday junction branch migration protein RuvA [Candidatus Peregrinibacteria bacterium]|nr:Holliday junction branch migration protein RuvA [Candidatus Peregrinibacteria bacterium]
MIAFIEGQILKKHEKALIVLTNQIGYLVHVPAPIIDESTENEEIQLFIHTKVREDDISLFGFKSEDQLNFFKKLINVNGVGAKTAVDILSENNDEIKNAIFKEDVSHLTKVPGIGKKTAERIVVELKNAPEMFIADISNHKGIGDDFSNDEVIDALLNLGYGRAEIKRTLKSVPGNLQTSEEIITYFLQNV